MSTDKNMLAVWSKVQKENRLDSGYDVPHKFERYISLWSKDALGRHINENEVILMSRKDVLKVIQHLDGLSRGTGQKGWCRRVSKAIEESD